MQDPSQCPRIFLLYPPFSGLLPTFIPFCPIPSDKLFKQTFLIWTQWHQKPLYNPWWYNAFNLISSQVTLFERITPSYLTRGKHNWLGSGAISPTMVQHSFVLSYTLNTQLIASFPIVVDTHCAFVNKTGGGA